ncbi:MAG: hypothetical protein ACYDHW_06910 [Syntrophorhabdaceae bacterium]
MKIFKFKDFEEQKNHDRFCQIVLQKAIWCAKPSSLNDHEEFQFEFDYRPSPHTATLLSEVVGRYNPINLLHPGLSVSSVLHDNRLQEIAKPIIDDVIDNCRKSIGIASFSSTNDSYLWITYGGKGNGVCIEIEIPDEAINISYHPVNYVSEKLFHIDSFLESAVYPDRAPVMYRNMLLTKTMKWLREQEIRFISKCQGVPYIIDGRIIGITFGPLVPAHIVKLLEIRIIDHCKTNHIKIGRL